MPKEHQIHILLASAKRTGKRNELGLIVAPQKIFTNKHPVASFPASRINHVQQNASFVSVEKQIVTVDRAATNHSGRG